MVDEKRTLELRVLRPPLQLLKLPSVGSGQGTLGAQASPTSTELPLVPALSRSPWLPRAPPRLELQEVRTPPVVRTPLRERVEPATKCSGPHTTPPRVLLTAAEKKPSERLTPGVRVLFSFSCLGGPKTVTVLKSNIQVKLGAFWQSPWMFASAITHCGPSW